MSVSKYKPAWWVRWIGRPLIRGIFRIIFLILARIKIYGLENIPQGQPYIVAINHISLFEAPFIGVFWPRQLEVMGAVDIWNKPGQNILARLWGGIPVHRGEYDRALFDKVLNVLSSGYPLLIAPEGGRSHTPGLRQAKPGIAYLVEQSGLSVLPVGIVGTTDDFWEKAIHGKRPQLEMHIGKGISLPSIYGKGNERRISRQENADLVMRHIAGLLPDDYRGTYRGNPVFQNQESDQ